METTTATAGTPAPTRDQMAQTRQAFTDVGLLTY